MRPVLYIMRGVPGSGKSTWLKEHHPDILVCSADHYFTDSNTGEYTFVPTKLCEAHERCWYKAFQLIDSRQSLAVDNTNVDPRLVQPYLSAARIRGYRIVVVTCRTSYLEAYRRNVHGVPLETVCRMLDTLSENRRPWDNVEYVEVPT